MWKPNTVLLPFITANPESQQIIKNKSLNCFPEKFNNTYRFDKIMKMKLKFNYQLS